MNFSTHLLRAGVLGATALLPVFTSHSMAQNTSTPPAAPERDIPALLRALRTAPAPVEKAADGTVVPQTMTSPSGKKLTLQFHDEFDAVPDVKKDGKPYIDRSKWQTTFWQGSSIRTLGANGEAQYYMDKDYGGAKNIPLEQRPNPFSFEKPGVLTISATKVPRELWGNYWMGEKRPFSSGLLISDKRFVFQYGYIEGRFKLPKNRGAWPAFWLLPNNPARSTNEAKNHPWPPEIDIFEAFGHAPTKFSTNIHSPKGQKVKLSKFMHEMGVDLTEDFHTWGMEWDAERVVFYFDGKEVSRAEITDAFRQPMYLLVNLAVGGNWYADDMKAAKTPYKAWEVDEASMPWKMDVDYVRVYQDPNNLFPEIAASNILPVGFKPTAYPDPKDEAAWPGKGAIRVHPWMTQNRDWYSDAHFRDQNTVVFAGDSLIGGWKVDQLSKAFPNIKASNRGIGGDVSRGLLFRWKEDVLALKPRAIVLLIGTNDLSAHGNPADVEHNIALMIDQARAQNPEVPIVLCTVPPRDVADAPLKPGALADLNARIVRLGAEKRVEVVDLFTPLATPEGKPVAEYFGEDRIHITPAGYKVVADVMNPVFEKLGLYSASAPAAVVADGVATTPAVPAVDAKVPGVDGPTPYPSPTNEAAWPGKGPIRVHPWMKQQRGWFWNARERDQNSVVFVGSSAPSI